MSIPLYFLDPTRWEDFKVQRDVAESTHWRIGHFTVGELDPERLYHLQQGRDCGTGDFTALYFRKDFEPYADVAKVTYSEGRLRSKSEWAPMMSDSKAEIIDHFAFMDKAAMLGEYGQDGSVLITGLGLGMVAEACVKFGLRTTVVDRDPEVIELIASQIDHPLLTVVEADAFTWEPSEKFDFAWHDIWPTITAGNVPEMHRMKRHYRPFVRHWQGSWAYERCKWMVREETRTDPTGWNRYCRDDPRALFYQLWLLQNPEEGYADMVAKQRPEMGNSSPRHLFHAITGRPAPGMRVLP